MRWFEILSLNEARKFNPDFDSSIIRNFKDLWNQQRFNEPLVLTDEEIWDAFQDWYSVDETDITEFPNIHNRRDAAILVGIKAANDDKLEKEGKLDENKDRMTE